MTNFLRNGGSSKGKRSYEAFADELTTRQEADFDRSQVMRLQSVMTTQAETFQAFQTPLQISATYTYPIQSSSSSIPFYQQAMTNGDVGSSASGLPPLPNSRGHNLPTQQLISHSANPLVYGDTCFQGKETYRTRCSDLPPSINFKSDHNVNICRDSFSQEHVSKDSDAPFSKISEENIEISRLDSKLAVERSLVCFGMVIGISGSDRGPYSSDKSKYSIRFQSPESFVKTEDPTFKGSVNPQFTYLINALLDETGLEFEAYSSPEDSSKSASKGKSQRFQGLSRRCILDIIIYGPLKLFQDVGSFFEEHDLFLQDPVDCKRNVQYCNPHRLPLPDGTVFKFTHDLTPLSLCAPEMEDVSTHPELLDLLNSQDDLPETPQPQSVRTPLAKHQKQALTFMLQRECGWAWDGSRPDIWEAAENAHGHHFINRISDSRQMEEPPQFYGGIISDPMGLGKTLSMISLIASDIHRDGSDPSSLSEADKEESSGRTLVIVPPPLLGTWEEQLTEHIFPNSLPWRRHHAKSRLSDLSEIEDVMIVLTTYHTVATEWRNGNGAENSILFRTRWKRVILDEAHIIRNSESQMARSICALDSVSRWAVTGTPVQNRLGDLAALLKFLKVYPYFEKSIFEAHISLLWKSGNVDEAIKRLKRLSGCLLLRRPKGIIELPPRHDMQCPVNFTPAERNLYNNVRIQAINHLSKYADSNTFSFVNTLQRIEAMRMVCNLGVYYTSRHEMSNSEELDGDKWEIVAQRAFNLQREMGQAQCSSCHSTVDAVETLLGDSTQRTEWWISQCLGLICSACVPKQANKKAICTHNPSCPVAAVSTDSSMLDDPLALSGNLIGGVLSAGLPSKVAMLLHDLAGLAPDTKCIVFSTWRMTLDVVEAGLKQAVIPYLRFDGKVPQSERQGIINRFRNEPYRVLLLTLSCGAVGLTLTAASRAYLMEPHWNPTLEDQALARIHRMGQKKEVTTVRFYIRDSFEERVIKVQETKRDLAGILLNPNSEVGGKTGVLELLRTLI